MKTTKGAQEKSTLESLRTLLEEIERITDAISKEKSQKRRESLAIMAVNKISEFRSEKILPDYLKEKMDKIEQAFGCYRCRSTEVQRRIPSIRSKSHRETKNQGNQWDDGKGFRMMTDPEKFNKVILSIPMDAKQLLEYIFQNYGQIADLPKDPKECKLKERSITISVRSFWNVCGLDLFPNHILTEEEAETLRKKRRKELEKIDNNFRLLRSLQIDSKGKRNLSFSLFEKIERISGPDDDPYQLQVALSTDTAYYINSCRLYTIFHKCLFKLGPKEDVAWSLGIQMQNHFYQYSNWSDPDEKRRLLRQQFGNRKGVIDTHNKLSVSALYESLPLPREEEVNRHTERIARQLIKALERLDHSRNDSGIGLAEYTFYKKTFNGLEEITPEKFKSLSWAEMKNCTIEFETVNAPADLELQVRNYWDLHNPKRKAKRRKETAA